MLNGCINHDQISSCVSTIIVSVWLGLALNQCTKKEEAIFRGSSSYPPNAANCFRSFKFIVIGSVSASRVKISSLSFL